MSSRSGGRRARAAAAGRAGASLLLAVALLLPAEPAQAQNFFERLFRPTQPQPQPQAPAPRPQPAPQPQSQPQGQPRRSAPTQPGQPGQAAQPNAPQQPAPPPQQEGPPPPYEPELLRLAEIIGSLAFLRQLCAMPDAPEWPRRMQALLDAEGTTPGRRERIAGAYNRGFRAYGLTYRVCTPSATEATNRYLKEGEQIARNMSTRYGG
jgi:uncharacterized protein (TIGR02301 family)